MCLEGFALDAALECGGYQSRALSQGERRTLYSAFLNEARQLATELDEPFTPGEQDVDQELESLKFFSVPDQSVSM